MKVIIPNLFTCFNLLCGCMGIVFACNGHMLWSSYLIGMAVVADFLDGFLARLLKAESDFGKQLDSLADMVTFGVLPGVMLYQFISIGFGEYYLLPEERDTGNFLLALTGMLIPLCAALRLAKFNVDTKQSTSFLGLPTPAAAIFVGSFPVIMETQFSLNFYFPLYADAMGVLQKMYHWDWMDVAVVQTLFNPWFYIWVSVIIALLFVLRIPMISFKFKSIKWADNKVRYLFLFLCLLMVGITFLPYSPWVRMPYLDYILIPLIVILYLLVSVINNLFRKKNEIQS